MKTTKRLILSFIDFFYPPFRNLMPLQTFRYAACGGSNAVLNWIMFGFCNNILLGSPSQKQTIDLVGHWGMKPYTICYLFALAITFPIGFILNKYVVFQESDLKGHIQLFRYGMMAAFSIFMNWALLHVFAGWLNLWPTPSQIFITIILAVISYFVQRNYSFGSSSKKEATI